MKTETARNRIKGKHTKNCASKTIKEKPSPSKLQVEPQCRGWMLHTSYLTRPQKQGGKPWQWGRAVMRQGCTRAVGALEEEAADSFLKQAEVKPVTPIPRWLRVCCGISLPAVCKFRTDLETVFSMSLSLEILWGVLRAALCCSCKQSPAWSPSLASLLFNSHFLKPWPCWTKKKFAQQRLAMVWCYSQFFL